MRAFVFIQLSFLLVLSAHSQTWHAKWISCKENAALQNSFFAYRKQVFVSQVPQNAIARISVDSKYWLWINDKQVVYEGGLKRGPNPNDTYYDEIDIAPYLKPGENIISLMVWYFGIDGLSHKSSGKAGLLFDCPSTAFTLISDSTWQCSRLNAYQTASVPLPNYRLSESNVLYNAVNDIGKWQSDLSIRLDNAIETGNAGDAPWNALVKRPIPFWKDYGLKNYPGRSISITDAYTITAATLPYNAQVSPYFKINSPEAGLKIIIDTDNYRYYNASEPGMRFEYITRKGVQEFEMPGWINGHEVYYYVPKKVDVLDIKFRETGYDAEFDGGFTCADPFFNRMWQKSARTLYVNMRDSYMDCPDRERAQWTGDAVQESAQAFYALSPSGHLLSKKWLTEIINWKKSDGSMYSPVPGNWTVEFPDQVFSTIGYYGLWNYYMNTGDRQMLADYYPAIQKYLALFAFDEAGMITERAAYPFWIDRSKVKDITLMADLLFYTVLQCLQQSALVLGKPNDYIAYTAKMDSFRTSFNNKFWNGSAYRAVHYTDATDERVQAFAVLTGIADKSKYPAILAVLRSEEHASPYMEKYIAEALFVMNNSEYALQRLKKRFSNMVNDDKFSTLWEDWTYGKGPNGNSTINHGWSGGGLIILSQYLCGIAPLEAGYKTFQVIPQPAGIANASATVSSVAGIIKSAYSLAPGKFTIKASVPSGTNCVIGLKNQYERILVNGKLFWENGIYQPVPGVIAVRDNDSTLFKIKVQGGDWEVSALSFLQSKRPLVDITAVQKRDSLLCQGDTLVLTNRSPGANIQWYKNNRLLKNSTNSFLNIWDSGYYFAVTRLISGRFDTSNTYHVSISIYDLPVQPVVYENNLKELIANTDSVYQWYRNEIPVPGAVFKTYKPVSSGLFAVRAIENGCISLASATLIFITQPLVSIDEKQFITLFPNPATSYTTIAYTLNGNKPVQVSIAASNGTKIRLFQNVQSGDRISLEDLAPGVYIVTIQPATDSKPFSIRLIK